MAEDSTLSLQETADLLDVHYMTVYRWVRTGLLPASKQGSQWRVLEADAEARRAAPNGAETTPTPGPRRRVDHAHRLADRLLAGDEGGATRVVDDALAGGLTPEELSLDVLTDALHEVGDAWEAGKATVAEEHQASVIAQRLVARLADRFTRRGRKRGPVVLGTVAGDHHGLPVALLAGPLRGRGHRVVELGGDTPATAFADAVREHGPVVAVGIFSAFEQTEAVTAAVAAVRAEDPDARVVVGGSWIEDDETAASLGADAYGGDGWSALEALSRS